MAVRICWLGHSGLALELTLTNQTMNLLIDPFLSGNPVARTKPEDLAADYILVSHGHFDHVGDSEAIAARTGATIIANFEIASWFGKKGLKAHGMQPGGSFRFPFGMVKLTPAVHGSVLPDGSCGGIAAGFYLSLTDGPRIYDAADTGLFGDMRLVGEEGIDLAFLPIGDNFTMGPGDSIRALQMLQPKKVIPIHYNTFDLINQDVNSWSEQVKLHTSAQPVVPAIGEWISV